MLVSSGLPHVALWVMGLRKLVKNAAALGIANTVNNKQFFGSDPGDLCVLLTVKL